MDQLIFPEDRLAWSERLHLAVQAWGLQAALDDSTQSAEAFSTLAHAIARYQLATQPSLRQLWSTRFGQSEPRPPEERPLEDWPGVTTDTFRLGRVASFPVNDEQTHFETSGTTTAMTGRHHFRSLASYERLSVRWGRAALLPRGIERATVVALANSPDCAPHSSLGFMMHAFMRAFDGRSLSHLPADALTGSDRWLLHSDRVDVPAFRRSIVSAEARGEPLLLLATSFALAALLEALDTPAALPPRSIVMPTGGFKGRRAALSPARLGQAIEQKLGVEPGHVVAEYGMTELSSQLYEGGKQTGILGRSPGLFLEPPWLRVFAVDPISHEPVPPGKPGLAKFIDLCNIDSALCLLTQDLVIRHPEGLELIGRSPGAPTRGCSLPAEVLLQQV